MTLADTPEEAAYRRELRTWLADSVPAMGEPPDAQDWPGRRAYDTRWQRLLFDAGYAGTDWPADGGGRGGTFAEQLITVEELERAHAPYVGVNFVGVLHAGPTIAVEGSEEQRGRYCPPILRGDEVWCQGFSEPGAGSDLASLRTRAARDGEEYVVNGSKIWTSHAEVADLCELLVRTGPDGHKGITWLVLPMDTPGIEVRPLRTIAGSTEFAELYLDDVRIPVANRVGEENDGWRVTMTTLTFERGTAFVGELLQSMELLREIRDAAPPELLARVGRVGAELDALWALVRRNAPGGSVFKLAFSELRQRLGELAMAVLGRDALVRGEWVDTWINSLSRTIAAGTSQIQRNIVAERTLGLPKR